MSLKISEQAPGFSLPSTSGKTFKLEEDFKGKACLIFFYPKDQTKGCTREVCSFRDNFTFFRSLNIPVVGISRDNLESHLSFKKMHRLPFELLSDEGGEVCKTYDALIPFVRIPKRITYLLDQDHKVLAIHEGLFDGPKHVSEMMEKIRSIFSGQDRTA